MQTTLVRQGTTLRRSDVERSRKEIIEKLAKEHHHVPVWDGKFCRCRNLGCTCRAWVDKKGNTDGNLLTKRCCL